MLAPAQLNSQPCLLDLFLVAVEESGDQLGAALMRALRRRTDANVRFTGLGGSAMKEEGLASLYPVDDLAIIGFTAVPRRLPRILRLIRLTAKEIAARRPHALIIIDSPAFTCRVARRVHRTDPEIPIIEYVSPSVWAWRPGRAKELRGYIDHILALLPFEPEVHQRLGGPPCTYVGHPAAERLHELRPSEAEARRRLRPPPVLLMLPGSRQGEIARLLPVFIEAVSKVKERISDLEVIIPTVPRLLEPIRQALTGSPIQPRIVVHRPEKDQAFRIARAALAKSGTVTLELALARVPMVTAYQVSRIEAALLGRRIVSRLPSIILANIVLAENVVPEFLQHDCTADNLAHALVPLLEDSPARRHQIEAFSRLDTVMQIGQGTPAARAAEVVLDVIQRARKLSVTPRDGAGDPI
jgi:lipid-A-disaccharide synthase